MMLAAVAFLCAYAWTVLGTPAGESAQVAESIMWTTWVLFAGDFVVRLGLAPSPARWLLHHLHELAMVVLPVLRPLRLLRLVTLLGCCNGRPEQRCADGWCCMRRDRHCCC